MPRSLALALTAALGGCSLVLGYPAAVPETGALCANASDDDLDGVSDCADASCDGSPACTETTEAECRDERDNDGDGRRDAEDLGCWPHVEFVATRCESIAGSEWRSSYRAGAGAWASIEGGVVALDPIDPAADVVTLSAGGTMLGPRLTGGLTPTSMTAAIEISDAALVEVGLAVDGADLRAVTPIGFFVTFEHGALLVSGSNELLLPAVGTVTGTRWVELAIDLSTDMGSTRYAMRLDGVALPMASGAFTGSGVGEVPGAVVEGRPLVPMIRVVGGSARVRDVHVTRSSVRACGRSVPQLDGTLRSLVRGPDGYCGILEGDDEHGGRARVVRSDDLERFVEVSEISGPGVETGDTRAAGSTLLLDTAGAYEGLLAITTARQARPLAQTLLRITGARCDALAVTDLFAGAALPSANGIGISPGLALGEPPAARFRATLAEVFAGASVSLTLAHLESDDGLTYTFAGLEELPMSFYADTFGGLQFLDVGNDRAMIVATDRGLDVILEGEDGVWRRLETPLLEPSGRPGTFDEELVSSPMLLLETPAPPSERPRDIAHVAFTGAVACDDAPDPHCTLPSGVLELRFVPRTSAP
jgi:hypothetical protein